MVAQGFYRKLAILVMVAQGFYRKLAILVVSVTVTHVSLDNMFRRELLPN